MNLGKIKNYNHKTKKEKDTKNYLKKFLNELLVQFNNIDLMLNTSHSR